MKASIIFLPTAISFGTANPTGCYAEVRWKKSKNLRRRGWTTAWIEHQSLDFVFRVRSHQTFSPDFAMAVILVIPCTCCQDSTSLKCTQDKTLFLSVLLGHKTPLALVGVLQTWVDDAAEAPPCVVGQGHFGALQMARGTRERELHLCAKKSEAQLSIPVSPACVQEQCSCF